MSALQRIDGGYEPARLFSSVAAWMRRTVEAGQDVSHDQVLAWAKGIEAAAEKAAKRDAAAASAQTQTDRISAEGAEQLYDAAVCALARLLHHAQQAATLDEMKAISRDTSTLCDALDALALGVVRRDSPPQEGA